MLCLGATLVSTSIASGAAAQGMRFGAGIYYNEPDLLVSPRSVVFRLQDRGFTEITRPRFDGTAYIIEATNPAGLRTRLFVDARDGGIISRQRLEMPYYPASRPARPAPGYGWTEEDMRPGRIARVPDGMVPPADIPGAPQRSSRFEPQPGPAPFRQGAETNPADANPSGVNPDARGRSGAPQRKSAKLTQPQKPVAPAVAPSAPTPSVGKSEPAKPTASPGSESATVESPKSETLSPAAVQPNAADKPTPPAKKDAAWQDPPADEAKRKVRVIDGATVVPGSGEAAAPSTN